MLIELNPCKIEGNIYAPVSKSMLIRVLAAAVLCNGTTVIKGVTALCDDAAVAMNIIKSLGAEIQIYKNTVRITGKSINRITDLYCGESALCARMFAPVVGFFSDDFKVSGKNSLLKRNIGDLAESLNLLGLQCGNEKYLPLRIKGKLRSGKIKINAGVTSQTLSGLLMILPLCEENSVVTVENLHSKPYIDLTVNILQLFGIKIINESYKRFFIEGNQSYQACTMNMEGDWSGASCLLAAAATGGSITVENLNHKSAQADAAMINVLRLCGASVTIDENKITVEKKQLNSFEFDATDCPDLFPAIVALSANCQGVSMIKGALRLQNKESDRAGVLQREFAKLNVKIELESDIMYITGSSAGSATVDTQGDHRIAMSLAVASVNATGNITVENAECVAKSYPDFWKDFFNCCKL
ncbi:MAG: 3-phosphoshikimate 1-carboxyvinyltransferase [Prevotellaceae bacterium]|jgi:3-phosphoshikimate 1-carboxyvinyltransferase|nr:3-phosphoshikimate 1-carboxyvinyltransferase [Prevotellaceae bacterium]